jgi:DNA modification methylase
MAIREIPAAEAHETVQLLVLEQEEHGAPNVPDRKYQNDVWHIAQSQSTVGLRTVGTKSTTLKHGGKAAHTLKEHPAPYPVELPRAFMGYLTAPGEIVFDPFGGSGSTLIACEQLRRCARLVELDPLYCQIVIDRWEAFTGQKAVKVG